MVGPRSLWSQGGSKAIYTLNFGIWRVLNFCDSIGSGTQRATFSLSWKREEVPRGTQGYPGKKKCPNIVNTIWIGFIGVRVSLVAQMVKNPPAMCETWVMSWVRKIPWRRERLPTSVFWPGELHRLCSPWGRKESDTTEQLSLSLS